MRTKYLLPCSCGEKIAVDASQAGEQVRCVCGANLDVPSLRGLRQLETAEAAEPLPARSQPNAWGLRQGLRLAGTLLMVAGLLPALLLYTQIPEEPVFDQQLNLELNLRRIDEMTVDQTWMVWKQDVLGPGLMEYPMQAREAYLAQRSFLLRWITFSLSIAAIGIVLAIAGLAMRKRPA